MSRWLVTIGSSAAFALGGWVVGNSEEAQIPGIGPPPAAHAPQTMETITGKVTEQTKAPRGGIDGVKLEDGTWLHWPPHLEKYLGKLSEVGQEVSVEGRRQPGPHGEMVVEVFALTNVESESTFQREEMPPPPPGGHCPPHGPHAGPPVMNQPGMPPHGVQPPPPGPGRHGPPRPHQRAQEPRAGQPPTAGPGGNPPPPPEKNLQRIEDRLIRIEEQLGKLIDRNA